MPKSFSVHIERDEQVVRLSLREQQEHAEKTVQRSRRCAIARRHPRQRIVGPVQQTVSIDRYQRFILTSDAVMLHDQRTTS